MSQTVLHGGGLRWVSGESEQGPASCVSTSLQRAVFSVASKENRQCLSDYRRQPWGVKEPPENGGTHSGPRGRRGWL